MHNTAFLPCRINRAQRSIGNGSNSRRRRRRRRSRSGLSVSIRFVGPLFDLYIWQSNRIISCMAVARLHDGGGWEYTNTYQNGCALFRFLLGALYHKLPAGPSTATSLRTDKVVAPTQTMHRYYTIALRAKYGSHTVERIRVPFAHKYQCILQLRIEVAR